MKLLIVVCISLHLVVFAAATGAGSSAAAHVKQFTEPDFVSWVERRVPGNSLLAEPMRSRALAVMKRAKELITKHGCSSHLCFALDAGVFVSRREYQIERDFAALVTAVAGLDDRLSVSGVQYGLHRERIARRTTDVDRFLIDIEATRSQGRLTQAQRRALPAWRNTSRTAFVQSLRFCRRQSNRAGRSANKIVFLTDLRSPLGGARVTRRFRSKGGAVCAVGFGRGRRAKLERFTEGPRSVLGTEQVDDVLDLFEETVMNVCDVPRKL